MTVTRFLLRSLRRLSPLQTTTLSPTFTLKPSHQPQPHVIPTRSFAFSSAEEAAAERRRRKRRLRIEPPLHALQRDPNSPRPKRDPNQPDTTSALVGPRLSLHNRVQSLIRAGDLDNASVVARQSVFSTTRPTVFTCNAIIGSMYRAKRYSDAIALFTYFFKQCNIVPNVVSYNFLIVSYCESGEVDKGLEVYQHIKENAPFSPSAVTFRHLTKGLVDAGRIDEAVNLLWKMVGDGHGADSSVFNNVILGFLNLGNLEKANEFFDELKSRCMVYDGIVNATFMEWFFSQGRVREAMESYKSLLDKEFKMVPATCNVLLEVLLKWGRKVEAEALFDSMLDRHTPPVVQAVNSDTFNLMVNECFKEGRELEAYSVFKKAGKAPKSKPFAMDTAGFNNMIMRYCEKDMVDDAEKMYVELCGKSLSPDVNTYRTLIDAYLKLGRIDEAMEKYTKMVEAGLRVIPTYANKWFSELIENGKVLECVPILTKMGEKDPKPDATTYDIVIRALCAVSNYDTSLSLLQQMVSYGVGVTPVLKEHVLDVFDKVGRRDEIDRLLNARWSGYAANVSPAQRHGGANPNGYRQQTESTPHANGNGYRNGHGHMQQHVNWQQSNNGNDYSNRQQDNVRNTQQYDNGSYSGSGQQYHQGNNNGYEQPQYNNRSYVGNGQQYNTGTWNGNGNGNGQQYSNGGYNGNGQQYGSGFQNGQQYSNGGYNGNGQQYGGGSHYGNWQQNGSDQQVINGEQGYEQPQTGSVAL
ncbi:putative tetratricopeptide-like helical domain superfamily [Helianthus annuus]|uniref:pentatricopeptide repeat-containing protein At1g10270 n=1 Tax=Helianthus annuus TaxID=4232 RepID=UPI000B90197F|nr:pentatricopeptide repeat-containing protein At1g10270 [Helianthus annuus]KAJ0567909.1 putative tetratricopeptide-like helical domain superfamily [Helianthus annuus]KAJ0574353.1 putative tetratricopeptide-like helical domain superfamily [Helianthus annuus]KAJ0738690.1 putative tetratricopeptide-like helical domain superfamily [Helianthus annuus]KAJ0798570.1 putative tetratricopeptide-like helical domain superfamily [Helianthus annuus]